jgi:NAD(P)-dependent dehydrogenase (short-subunit alcohol dehydrogenase family)
MVQPMDVANETSIREAAEAIGERPIDILINNAGIWGGQDQSIDNVETADWIEAFRVMVIGPFRVIQAFRRNMQASASPKIVTITSQMGASTWPIGGSYAYVSAKAAVNRVMIAVARDLKDHAIVTLVHPGWVRTDLGGANADITTDESATGIRNVIRSLSQADSGKFYKWNGYIHPW